MKITSRYDKTVILYESDTATTLKDLVVSAIRDKANLADADLYKVDLSNANLRGADLRGADLSNADLYKADLHKADLSNANLYKADLHKADLSNANLAGADLSNANLRGADLSNANLIRADLYKADLTGANLTGAKINWQSHVLVAEILRRAAHADTEKRKIAGLILISTDWCWSKWLELRHDPLFDWAIDTLAAYVQDCDGAPDIFVNAKARIDASKAE